MNLKNVNREGYWATSSDDTTLPTPGSCSWKGRTAFLQLLDRAEKRATPVVTSNPQPCVICGFTSEDADTAGDFEFVASEENNGWMWPATMRHYIVQHNVRPSLAFEEFIRRLGATSLNKRST